MACQCHPGGARRFATLDAMRGVAAISVMFFHFFLGTRWALFTHGDYAVDFFFMLSGIVLSHAYAARIGAGMSFAAFLRARVIRLYPLYALGSLIGFVAFPFYIAARLTVHFGYFDTLRAAIFGAAFLPYPNDGTVPFIAAHGMWGALFPLDIPAWSLFFEMLASIALFLAVRRRISASLVAAASLPLLCLAVWHYRTLNIGWGIDTLLGGFPRTAFWFFLGIAAQRVLAGLAEWRGPLGPVFLLAATAVVFALPRANFAGLHVPVGLLCALAIPLLVVAAFLVGTERERSSVLTWLGRISYGIYTLHMPLYALALYALHEAGARRVPSLLLGLPLGALVVLLADQLTRHVDEPLRRWLSSAALLRVSS